MSLAQRRAKVYFVATSKALGAEGIVFLIRPRFRMHRNSHRTTFRAIHSSRPLSLLLRPTSSPQLPYLIPLTSTLKTTSSALLSTPTTTAAFGKGNTSFQNERKILGNHPLTRPLQRPCLETRRGSGRHHPFHYRIWIRMTRQSEGDRYGVEIHSRLR